LQGLKKTPQVGREISSATPGQKEETNMGDITEMEQSVPCCKQEVEGLGFKWREVGIIS
jgi:hypothetical protein